MKPPQSPSSAYSRVQSAPGSRSPVRGDSATRHGSAAVGGGSRAGSGAIRRGGTASRVSRLAAHTGCPTTRAVPLRMRTDLPVLLSDVRILRPDLALAALATTSTNKPHSAWLAYEIAPAA